jgi:hypothetical protein
MTAKTITLKLPPDLYSSATKLARRRKISLSRLFQEGLEMLRKNEDSARFYDSFTLIGGDRKESDVKFAADAQAEVVRHECS